MKGSNSATHVKNPVVEMLFVHCDQRSEVAADYDSLRILKNPGCVCVWMDVCMYDRTSDRFS